jgi:hypothetical protein
LGCTDRAVDHSDVFAAEDLVECRREFAVAVVDEEPVGFVNSAVCGFPGKS